MTSISSFEKVWNVRNINIIFRTSKTTRHNDKNGWKCEILPLFRRHFSALYLWKYWCVSVSSSFLSLRFHQIERLHFVIVLILKLWNDAPTYTVNSKEYSHHIITRIIMRMLQLAHLAVHLLLRDPRVLMKSLFVARCHTVIVSTPVGVSCAWHVEFVTSCPFSWRGCSVGNRLT